MTSREAAILAYGLPAVQAYENVKAFYTRYGSALEQAFADRVGGRQGKRGEADVVTPLGGFEFCAAANTKNSAGEAAQRARGYVIVQVSGKPTKGRISGVEFLRMHRVIDAERVAGECQIAAIRLAKPDEQTLFS